MRINNDLPVFKIKSTNLSFIKIIASNYIESGYIIKKHYSYKKFCFFGKRVFVIEMVKAEKSYRLDIKEALEKEDYREVQRLTEELNKFQNLT